MSAGDNGTCSRPLRSCTRNAADGELCRALTTFRHAVNLTSPSGLQAVPYLPWGSHVTHFFGRGGELRDLLVPYFKAGLENNERCLWVTGAAFTADEARQALRTAVHDIDRRERAAQIEIVEGGQWYAADQRLQPQELVSGLLQREQDALQLGYTGLRTQGNCAWVSPGQWDDFQEYESLVQHAVRGRRMICMCSYCHEQLGDGAYPAVMARHDMVLPSPSPGFGPSPSPVSIATPTAPRAVVDALATVDQSVLDAMPLGVYACDAAGRILRVNRKAIELWGRAPRLLDSAQLYCGSFRLETLTGKPIAAHETPMACAVGNGESFDGAEAVVENPDGRRWIARVDIAPLHDAEGRLAGAINCFQDVTHEHEMRRTLERQQRTFELAMLASQMGTWRYTLADNICIYDANAQRLYGLTEARLLHDQDGVTHKFHPDDIGRMWARVTRALEPGGDGRYEVEYRVKQLDGSWRWVSAWGLVEFEGTGAERKPVAIAGASRDLSERKEAERLQQLLIDELNHRIKNTLATLQAVATQTLRAAKDMPAALEALERRIVSMAGAHDLLTARTWTGANLGDIVRRAVSAFAPTQVTIAGAALDVTPRHTLALSLALHELATNATKYGALSRPEGRVTVRWTVRNGRPNLDWVESGGPAVARPTRNGFGTLLIDGLVRDLGGEAILDYAPAGVHCRITAAL